MKPKKSQKTETTPQVETPHTGSPLGTNLTIRSCGHVCQDVFQHKSGWNPCDPCGGWGCECGLCLERGKREQVA